MKEGRADLQKSTAPTDDRYQPLHRLTYNSISLEQSMALSSDHQPIKKHFIFFKLKKASDETGLWSYR